MYYVVYMSLLLCVWEIVEIIVEWFGLQIMGIVFDLCECEFGDGEGMFVFDYIQIYGDWYVEVFGVEFFYEVGECVILVLYVIVREVCCCFLLCVEFVFVVVYGGVICVVIDYVFGGIFLCDGEVLKNGLVYCFVVVFGYL